MKRLWVRLSITISGLILLFTILPLFTFLIFPPPVHNYPAATTQAVAPPARRSFDPWHDLPENLVESVLLASVVGIIGGIAASRILASPITKLANAAQAIGTGDLSTRVTVKTNTKEFDELADSFNKMAADLQRAAEVRNNLMADVSHELRTPLTVLEGNLRAALDHVYELDDEQIANLYEQTHHLIQLVSELRELTLAEAYQLPLDKQPVDLTQLVQETVSVFEPLAEDQQVKLTAQLAPELPPVTADRSRLRQVLHNLLANALRHTPPGGKIVVAAQVQNGRATLSVQDSGEGIDASAIGTHF